MSFLRWLFHARSREVEQTAEDREALARTRQRLLAAMVEYQETRAGRPPVEIFLGSNVIPDAPEQIDAMLAAFLGRRAVLRFKGQS